MEKTLLDYMKQVTDHYTNPEPLSANEVVNLFLEEEQKQQSALQANNYQEVSSINLLPVHMDLQELEKWRNKNNNKFEIRASLPITSHRKIIGKLIVRLKRIARHCLKWYIDPIVEQQNEFNGSLTASVNAIYNNDVVAEQFMQQAFAKIVDQENKLNKQAEELTGAFNEIEKLTQVVESLKKDIHHLDTKQTEIEDKTLEIEGKTTTIKNKALAIEEELKLQGSTHEQAIKNLSQEINEELVSKMSQVDDTIEKTQENIHYLTYKFNKAKKDGIKVELVKAKEKLKEEKLKVKDNVELDYFLFENKFRGAEKSIKKNQEYYLPYFENKKNILDIGCGRGEFLELMNEKNIPANGVDVYDEFVEYCKDKGLKAVVDDALSYVRTQPDNSIDGIFMSQVAEHLENDYLLNLVAVCYEKMEKGSYFIAETPNPTNLSTFTSSFYLDPSHVKPVHPETFKFMLEYVGFKDVQIIYTESSKSGYRLPLLNASGASNLEEFNSGINCLSDALMGSLDYAVIARK